MGDRIFFNFGASLEETATHPQFRTGPAPFARFLRGATGQIAVSFAPPSFLPHPRSSASARRPNDKEPHPFLPKGTRAVRRIRLSVPTPQIRTAAWTAHFPTPNAPTGVRKCDP